MKYEYLRITFCVLLGLSVISPLAEAADPTYQSYLAHIAAANSAVRLNEPAEAKRWLDNSPPEHRGWEYRYLDSRLQGADTSISLGEVSASRLSVSADSRTLAVPLSTGEIRLYDLQSWQLATTIKGHTSAVYGADFTPDGNHLVSCSRDTTIRVWELATGNEVWQMKTGGHGLADLEVSPDGKYIGYAGWYRTTSVVGFVTLINLQKREVVWRKEFGEKPIVAVRFSPDSRKLAVGTWGWRVAMWDLANPEETMEFDFDDVPLYSAIDDFGFSPDGSRIIAATKNGTPRVWAVATGKIAYELHGHTRPVFGSFFTPDGSRICTAGSDGTLKIWSATHGHPLKTLFGHTDRIVSAVITPNGKQIASVSVDGTLRFWDGSAGTEFSDPAGVSKSVFGFALSPDGKLLAANGPDTTIALWNAIDGTLMKRLRGMPAGLNALAFSPDGKSLLGSNWDTTVTVWDIASGEATRMLSGQLSGSAACAISRDGAFYGTAVSSVGGQVWDAISGAMVATLPHAAGGYSIAFSPDNRTVVLGTVDGSLLLIERGSWRQIAARSFGRPVIHTVAFSPDGKSIAAACSDGKLRIVDASTLETTLEAKGHSQSVYTVAWSPDGARFVSGSADLTARVWDIRTGETVLILSDFYDPVYSAAFSPDGSRLYLNASGAGIRMLDANLTEE